LAARKAKLDPDNIRTAKDIMDEKERKRKRDLGEELEDEVPKDSQVEEERTHKKPKVNGDAPQLNGEDEEDATSKAERRKEKRQRKLEKKHAKKEKKERNAETRQQQVEAEPATQNGHISDEDDVVDMKSAAKDLEPIDISGLEESPAPSPASPTVDSPAIDSTFSENSAIPSSTTSSPAPEMPLKPDSNDSKISKPKPDYSALQARLQARIDALRTARKADGLDGKPARSRAELIEARRTKILAKRANKRDAWKEQQLSEKEAQAAAEEELARLRGSGSPLTSGILSPGIMTPTPDAEKAKTNFTFGRVQFGDGSRLSLTNGLVGAKSKGKGPMDVKARIAVAEKKQEKLGHMDEDKRADIEEKDTWLAARRKLDGEKIKDDVSLLKRTLKRREKAKTKSSKEWRAREDGVKKSEEARQKKREGNLAKRRDEKKRGKGKKQSGGNSSANSAMKRAKYKAFGSSKPRS
jgi:Surfeit locus protein 6